jgi:hypothetical protein
MNRHGTPLSMGGGRYLDRFEKRDGRWAIAARVCVRDWAPLAAPPDVLDQAALTAVPLTPEIAEPVVLLAANERDYAPSA